MKCQLQPSLVCKKEKLFGKESEIDSSVLLLSSIRFEDTQANSRPYIVFDGIPFVIIGKKDLECHQGKDRHKKRKEISSKEQAVDHVYTKKRKIVQSSKKKDCPATIKIRHIVKFSEFRISAEGKRNEKDVVSCEIKALLKMGKDVRKEHVYLISIPNETEHKNHLMGEDTSLIQPIDDDLKKYIQCMVIEHNVYNTAQMKLLLEIFVKQTLFAGESIPSKLNKRFWPSMKDIKNHMALAIIGQRNTNVDQAVVYEMVQKWRKEYPNDKFELRVKEGTNVDSCTKDIDCSTGEDEGGDLILGDDIVSGMADNVEKKFVFIHQTDFQRRLLDLYGQEICLIDATYRTTQYAVPLYFICVATNVNYMTVATFVTETEDTNSLVEVLQTLKDWNPNWKPRFFMCDYANEEIRALETVFPESMVYLCDFHREQAWERWVNATHNGVHQFKAETLRLLRNIARASTEDEFEEAKTKLQVSTIWKNNKSFRNWFEKIWLSKAHRWVNAFRKRRFSVSINTNNGIERQNRTLKYDFLQSRKASSLSHLLQTIIESFNFDTYKKYRTMNINATAEARKYAANIPHFLTNRPPDVVKHCFTRWQEAQNIPSSDIDIFNDVDGTFIVKSQGPTDLCYMVNFAEDDIGLPSCQCKDWLNTHLPCKHFFAVFQKHAEWNWDALPLTYRQTPFLNLDVPSKNSDDITDQNLTEEISLVETDDDSSFIELPRTPSTVLKRARGKLISLSQILKDISYQCTDMEAITSATAFLDQVISCIKRSVPQTEEFILDDNNMTHIGTTIKTSKKKIKSIKRLKRTMAKRKGSGRYGTRAAMLRQHYTKDGVDKLSGSHKEKLPETTMTKDDNVIEEPCLEEQPYTAIPLSSEEQFINIFKEFISTMDNNIWNPLVDLAKKTHANRLDLTAEMSFAILYQLCINDTDAIANIMMKLTCLMPTVLPHDIRLRLVQIILEKMVDENMIKLEQDPRVRRKNQAEADAELLKVVMEGVQLKKGAPTQTNNQRQKSALKKSTPAKVDNRGKTIHFSQTVKFSSVSSTAVACAYPALGLRNGRNFCFANSVLQCLHVTEIHRLILLHKECLDPSCVVCHLKTFIQESSQTAEPILRQINGIWPEYRLGRQQDALEFLQIIMQEAYKRCSEESREKDHSYSLFYGTEKSTVKCGHCGAESSKEDVYSDICVSIDTVQTVTQAIQSHFSVEEVEYRCSICNKAGVATKKSTLEEIRKNFVVYLKRFNAGRRKLTKKIDLAFDINLRDYVSPGKMLEDKAQLFGVVVHAGHSVSNGHYYCFIKFGLNWFKIDDMKINSVTELSLTGCQDQPYILFYKTLPRPYTS